MNLHKILDTADPLAHIANAKHAAKRTSFIFPSYVIVMFGKW